MIKPKTSDELLLKQYRQQLLRTDKKLIRLLKKRFELTDAIGRYKAQEKLSLTQAGFWKNSNVFRKALADKMDLDSAMVQSVFNVIHTFSKKQQKEYFRSPKSS